MIMQTIGRFFAEEWQLALNNRDPFYIPAPNQSMTMDELVSIQQTLSDLVAYWENQVASNTNSEAIANATAIVDLEQSKLSTVNSIIALRESSGGIEVPVIDPIEQPTGVRDNTLLWVIGGLVGLGLYLKLRKKKRSAHG